MSEFNLNIKNRIDFVLLFDVSEGNPNGDPASKNTPRQDPYDGHGLVTDVCIKRKIRDYCADHGHRLFITREPVSLNSLLTEVAKAVDPPDTTSKKDGGKKGKQGIELAIPRAAELCKRFIDVRLFGAMAETGPHPAGRIRGPVQLCMGRSIHPARISKHQITRISVTTDEDLSKPNTMSDGNGRQIVGYAMYKMVGTFSPRAATKTGASEVDLLLMFEAMLRCWARDRASARGIMGCRGIFIAQHETEDGRCHASDVHDAVRVSMSADAMKWDNVGVNLTQGQRGVTWHEYGWDGLRAIANDARST